MRGPTNRRGAALPLTIFMVAVLTLTLAAAFVRVDAEREIAAGASDAVTALTVAQTGLQQYFGSRTTRPPDGDSLRVNAQGGYANVVARIVQRPADTLTAQMYIVRSMGFVISPVMGAAPRSVRVVAQFARWQPVGEMRRVAALTAVNQLRRKNGGTTTINGADEAGMLPSIASVQAASGSSVPGACCNPTESPDLSPSTIFSMAGVDWAMITGGGFTADFSSITPGTAFASYLVQGDATLTAPFSGTGLLMVTGDLTTIGGAGSQEVAWNGVVLVGCKINFVAKSTHFRGLVITGLNQDPTSQCRGDIGGGGGTKVAIDYNSQYVGSSLAFLRGFAPINNAWVDNWATY